MNGLDWAIVAILVLSVLLAAAQGFLHEVISLAGVVVGYLLAAWEYWRVARRIAPYVKSDAVAESAAFLGIFVAVVIAAGIIGRIARWLAREAGLGWADTCWARPSAWCAEAPWWRCWSWRWRRSRRDRSGWDDRAWEATSW